MKLKSFHTDVFAGINDIDVEFKDGLNVLIGPNEAGKSSIINALFVSLFIEPKLRYNYSDLKGEEFRDRFFPYPEGNFVNGSLVFSIGEDDYTIHKKWSNTDPEGHIILPDKSRIDRESIQEKRQELLPFGKSTYENIVFTKQEEVKAFLKNITEEGELSELKGVVSNILRKAVLELGDISIDKLGNKIEKELEDLTKKWDLDNNRPTNRERGLNNPLKQGYGKIYATYINKEHLRRDIKESKEKERAYQNISSELEDINRTKKETRSKKEQLEEIEDDILNRKDLITRNSEIIKNLETMNKVVENWPENKKEISKLNDSLEDLENELKELDKEKEKAQKFNKKKELEEKINEIDKIKEEIQELIEEKRKLNDIKEEKVDKLDKNKQKLDQAEASLKGARLKAKVSRASSSDISVIPGIEEERIIEVDEEIEAEGYINIKTEDIDIEVESAEIDYEEISKDYTQANEEYKKLLKELDVEGVPNAREKLQKLRDINNDINNKEDRVNDILEDKSYESLKQEQEKYKGIEKSRKIEKINKEIDVKKDEERKLETSFEIKNNKIKEWEDEYDSIEDLKNDISKLENEKKSNQDELKNLAELPEKFDTIEEYRKVLNNLRKEYGKLNDKFIEKREEMFKAKNELPDNSTEDMTEELKYLELDFKRLVERAERLVKIQDVYKKKLEEIDDQSFQPLIKSFSKYINILTDGKYKVSNLDESFQIELESENGRKLPADIYKLSFGTSDSTALALRFALFENMFTEQESFIVLDDCLVNLDPSRKENAIKLIQSFSKKYQVIFSTCNLDTAEKLGGNVIDI